MWIFLSLLLLTHPQTENDIPKTVQEAVSSISEMIPNTELAVIRRTSEDEFVSNAKFTLGVWMQEAWELWDDHELTNFFNEHGFFAPQEMAEIILMCYWRQLTQKGFDIEEVFEVKREEIRQMRNSN